MLPDRLTDRLREAGLLAGVGHVRVETAGADTVGGITPELTFDISTHGKRDPRDQPGDSALLESEDPEIRALGSTLARLDRRGYAFVVVEGFATAPLPTILVATANSRPLAVT